MQETTIVEKNTFLHVCLVGEKRQRTHSCPNGCIAANCRLSVLESLMDTTTGGRQSGGSTQKNERFSEQDDDKPMSTEADEDTPTTISDLSSISMLTEGVFQRGEEEYCRQRSHTSKSPVFLETRSTTVMIRNLQRRITLKSLLQLLDTRGFENAYDFAQLPCRKLPIEDPPNLGFAFINFISPLHAQVFCDHCEIFNDFRGHKSRRVSVVAAKIQGKEAILKTFLNSIDGVSAEAFLDGRIRFFSSGDNPTLKDVTMDVPTLEDVTMDAPALTTVPAKRYTEEFPRLH